MLYKGVVNDIGLVLVLHRLVIRSLFGLFPDLDSSG